MLLGADRITVTPQTGSYQDGIWVPSPGTPYSVTGTVVPAPREELERLPEGARERAHWVLYCESSVDLELGSGSQSADRLTWQGRDLVPIARTDYAQHVSGVPHRSYLLAEVGEDE